MGYLDQRLYTFFGRHCQKRKYHVMNECTLHVAFWMRGQWKDLLSAVGQTGDRIRGHLKFPKLITAYALCWIVGDWKNQTWRRQGDSFNLSPCQQLCSPNYGYLHLFWVCRQDGPETNLRFSLIQCPLVSDLEQVTWATSQTGKWVPLVGTPRRWLCKWHRCKADWQLCKRSPEWGGGVPSD